MTSRSPDSDAPLAAELNAVAHVRTLELDADAAISELEDLVRDCGAGEITPAEAEERLRQILEPWIP